MIREFLFSTAHRTTFELFPSQQREELEKTIAKLSPEKWPNVTFPQESLLEIDGDRVFHEGIELFMLGMARDRSKVRLKAVEPRSEEHTSELQSLMRNSYAVFCLKKKKKNSNIRKNTKNTSAKNKKQTVTNMNRL